MDDRKTSGKELLVSGSVVSCGGPDICWMKTFASKTQHHPFMVYLPTMNA